MKNFASALGQTQSLQEEDAVQVLAHWDAEAEKAVSPEALLRLRWDATIAVMGNDRWRPLMTFLTQKVNLKGPRPKPHSKQERVALGLTPDNTAGDWTPLMVAVVLTDAAKIAFLAPISDVEHQDNQQWDVLDFATKDPQVNPINGVGQLDFLATFASQPRAAAMFEKVGEAVMPFWAATQERQALAGAVDQDATHSYGANPAASTSVPAPSRAMRL